MPGNVTIIRGVVLAARPTSALTVDSFRPEGAPHAFLGLPEGGNFGKLVVRARAIEGTAA